jgi:hypothetical protein
MNDTLVATRKQSSFVRWFLFLSTSVVCLTLGLLAVYFFTSRPHTSDVHPEVDEFTPSMGYVYFSATLPSEDIARLFEVDLDAKTVKALEGTEGTYQITQVQNNIEATSFTNRDGRSFIEIITYDAEGLSKTSFVEAPVGAQVQSLSWNEGRTRLAYQTVTDGGQQDSYAVYVYDVAQNTSVRVADGFSPHFLTRDDLLFLRGDGVYTMRSGEGEPTKIYTHEGYVVTPLSNIISSPNKEIVTISQPPLSAVDVHIVAYSESSGVSIIQTKRVPGLMIMPIPSPDGRYFAYFEPHFSDGVSSLTLNTVDLTDEEEVAQVALATDMNKPHVMSFWR